MTTATETPTAATFKDFNGEEWVDITVQPGESLYFQDCGATDEGHCNRYWTYSHEGDHIRCEYSSNSRDCDGPHNDHSVSVCPLDRLTAVPAESGEDYNMPDRPDWKEESRGQRDHFAEAANY